MNENKLSKVAGLARASLEKQPGYFRKSAQSALDSLKIDPKAMMVSAGDRLSEFWASLSPNTRRSLVNAAMGGILGSGIAGAAGAYYAPEGARLAGGLSGGLAGYALGAGTAGLGTAAYNAMTSGRVLPGEARSMNPAQRLADMVVGGIVRNPGLTAGTGFGAYQAYRGIQDILRGVAELQPGSGRPGGRQIPPLHAVARDRQLVLDALSGVTGMGGAVRMAALPAGMGLGWLLDRYIKGRNQ